MNLKLKPLFEATVLSAVAFTAHIALLHFFWNGRDEKFTYSVTALYGIFFAFSILIISVLIRIKAKKIDSVGNTFMMLTCIKAILAYLLLHPILQTSHTSIGFEKANFFSVFAIFLTIETIVSVRMLNKS